MLAGGRGRCLRWGRLDKSLSHGRMLAGRRIRVLHGVSLAHSLLYGRMLAGGRGGFLHGGRVVAAGGRARQGGCRCQLLWHAGWPQGAVACAPKAFQHPLGQQLPTLTPGALSHVLLMMQNVRVRDGPLEFLCAQSEAGTYSGRLSSAR